MGPNALPPVMGEAPWIPPTLDVWLGLAAQRSSDPSGPTDYSMTVPFRVEGRFKQRATLFVEGTPFEIFTIHRHPELSRPRLDRLAKRVAVRNADA